MGSRRVRERLDAVEMPLKRTKKSQKAWRRSWRVRCVMGKWRRLLGAAPIVLEWGRRQKDAGIVEICRSRFPGLDGPGLKARFLCELEFRELKLPAPSCGGFPP